MVGGTAGFLDGRDEIAKFHSPSGIDIDKAGNLYVADSENNRIRKVTPQGEVTTVAGTGQAGLANGTAGTAKFSSPYGVTIAPDGTLYIADTNNHCIRKLSPETGVTTFAGGGTPGYKDDSGTAAKFNSPFSVTLDSLGNLIVADTGNNRIRRISPQGLVSTIAGSISGYKNGAANTALFSIPNDVAVASNGDIYVADFQNHAIRKISGADLSVSTFAGNGTPGKIDGISENARFNSPTGIEVSDSGDIFVADNLNDSIRRISSEGLVSTVTGGIKGLLDGQLSSARFDEPTDVVTDSSGNLYVVDTQNHRIRKIKL